MESTYGAAASLAVLLIWVYYASQIVLMGAELTHVHAQRHASPGLADRSSLRAPPANRLQDPLRVGVRRNPYAAVLIAIEAGWLLSRIQGETTSRHREADFV